MKKIEPPPFTAEHIIFPSEEMQQAEIKTKQRKYKFIIIETTTSACIGIHFSATTLTQHQLQCAVLLNVVIIQCTTILQLLT